MTGKYASLATYRSQSIKIAKDLGYGSTVISDIKSAKNESEITRILKTARENK